MSITGNTDKAAQAPKTLLSNVTNIDSKSKHGKTSETQIKNEHFKPRFGKASNNTVKEALSKPKFGKPSYTKVKQELPSSMSKAVVQQTYRIKDNIVNAEIDNEPVMDIQFADEDEERGKVILRKRKLEFKRAKEHKSAAVVKKEKQNKRSTDRLNSVLAHENNSSEKLSTAQIGDKNVEPLQEVSRLQEEFKKGEDSKLQDDRFASDEDVEEPIACPKTQRSHKFYVQSAIQGQGGYPDTLDGRYLLAWNFHGKVYKSQSSELGMWSYEVEKSSRSNRFKHTMEFKQADIGPSGVLLSSGQRLKYIPDEFGEEEWETDLISPSSAVALGDNYISLVTKDSCLRILTIAGVDLFVYRLPGSPIALAGTGKLLAVTYSVSSTLHVQFLNLEERRTLCEIALSFGVDSEHSSEIQWMHLSPKGNLFVMDTNFQVQLLSKGFDWSWVPILDLSSRQFVHPVWVIDEKSECLMVAGLSDGGCPDVRLPLEELKLKFPLTAETEKKEECFSNLMEMLFRKKLFFEQDLGKNQKKKKKVLEKIKLKAFSQAITSGLAEAKCIDIASRLEHEVSEKFAAKLAFDSGMHSLADMITAKSRKRLERKKQLEQQVKDTPGGGASSKEVNLGVVLATPSPGQSSSARGKNTPTRGVKRKLEGTIEMKRIILNKASRDGLVPIGANVISGSSAKKFCGRNPFKKN